MRQRANILAVAGFVVLVIVTFFLLGQQRNTQRLQAGFLGLISPFLKQGSAVDRRYKELREGLKSLRQLEEENKRLIIANKELMATNQTLRGVEAERNRLRKALGYMNEAEAVFQLMPARITARDASTWYQTVKIDRGSAELIEPDMPVLTDEGLVGKTTVVAEHSATVILISDENCRVAANVEGSPHQGIVRGERISSQSQPVITLNFLPKQANLKPGLKVYTSGVGGVFPSGVLIGAVKEFKLRELEGYATLVPAVDLSTLEDVFVVVGTSK
ncbi:MAG: rod shape-determining protein MreC [Verrucomicrobiota bacterium]|nr:rod shape-determining protein MreC [Verrucomicrobiota bacterium]